VELLMPFTVDLTPDAQEQLARVWTIAKDKKAVNQALERVESELRRDPQNSGVHLSEGLWLRKVHPLRVYYEIDSDLRIVMITDITLAEK
jgi:mRNA-degrading endonuclease RelE of RelBE toxin-antitoxin system